MILDTHEHIEPDNPTLRSILDRNDVRVINICIAFDPGEDWRAQAERYRKLAERHPHRYAWCTSFSLPEPEVFADPRAAAAYTDAVIARLEEDFNAGAVACKVWKNFGMQVKDENGNFVLIDNSVFDPIFEFMAGAGRPLIAHLAEPLACWKPLSEDSPHYEYYSTHLEWHMHGKEGMLSHEEIIASRDRFLARHPELIVVGAHLGSQEHDVSEVAARLDRYPNYYVDIAARLPDLLVQDRDTVRAFFQEYQDRILFGTDMFISPEDVATEAGLESAAAAFEEQLAAYLAFINSDREIQLGGFSGRGLGLPADVVSRVLSDNAHRLMF